MIVTSPVISATNIEPALTEIEALGLASQHDLANGHASQELAASQQRIIESLTEIWVNGTQTKSRQAELKFKSAFLNLAQTPSLTTYKHFKVCPTASNSIDTVATWLAEKKLKTALIEPTFDNLFLILKRRGVELTALSEEVLHDTVDLKVDAITGGNSSNFSKMLNDVDAVFLVNPNNPTGKVLSEEQFTAIVQVCAQQKKVVVLDNTFRFFVAQVYDSYKILLESGVTFLSIEDTGKVWPTQEIKASLLITSANVSKEIDIIYDEIFLCHSNFALGLLGAFMTDAQQRGLSEAVWNGVAKRRKLFRKAIEGSILELNPESLHSTISVEWVQIKDHFDHDLALVEHFKSLNLVMLPGRQFYWSKRGTDAQTKFARFALLKPESEFQTAIEVLSQELRSLS